MTEREMGYVLGKVDAYTKIIEICDMLVETAEAEEMTGIWEVKYEVHELLEKELK